MKGVITINYEIQSNMFLVVIARSIMPAIVIILLSSMLFSFIRKKVDDKVNFVIKGYWIPYTLAIVLFIISLVNNDTFYAFLDDIVISAKTFAFKDTLSIAKYALQVPTIMWWIVWCVLIGTYMFYLDFSRLNRNYEIIKGRKKKEKHIDDWKLVNLDFDKNIFICGKNGAGKGIAISNFVKRHIAEPDEPEFALIIDGKGDVGEHSLYDIVTRLCLKHNRKIYILNQSIPDETDAYNPFLDCNATQIKDMLINMSEWSEEHYKSLAGEYYQSVAQFMLDVEIPVTFKSITKYSNSKNWVEAMRTYKEFLDPNDVHDYLDVIGRCGTAVAGTISRFSTISKGEGKKIFRDGKTFNLQRAYDENAVVLVMLNNLEYTDFARSLGMLVLNDMKNVLGKITKLKGQHKKFLCVYDELSVYFCQMIIDIVNKSRSLGATNILSTQSIADMDIIDEEARRIVINNMHAFYLLKQADDKSAETLCKAVGTKLSTELTSKIDSFGKTGQGTVKIVDEFRVNPNKLKNLPLEVGYWVDTTQEDIKIFRTRMPYVDVHELKEYDFWEQHA